MVRRWLLALTVAWLANSVRHVSVYQIRTAIGGVRGLLSLPREGDRPVHGGLRLLPVAARHDGRLLRGERY